MRGHSPAPMDVMYRRLGEPIDHESLVFYDVDEHLGRIVILRALMRPGADQIHRQRTAVHDKQLIEGLDRTRIQLDLST